MQTSMKVYLTTMSNTQKSILGWKLTMWGWGSDLPPPPECVAATKILPKVGEDGVSVKSFGNKKRSKWLVRKSQEISDQSNTPFLTGYVQKFGGQMWPSPPRIVIKWVESVMLFNNYLEYWYLDCFMDFNEMKINNFFVVRLSPSVPIGSLFLLA